MSRYLVYAAVLTMVVSVLLMNLACATRPKPPPILPATSKVGFLVVDSAEGKEIYNDVVQQAKEEGFSVAGIEFYPPNTQDFSSLLRKFDELGAGTIWVVGTKEHKDTVRDDIRKHGISVRPAFTQVEVVQQPTPTPVLRSAPAPTPPAQSASTLIFSGDFASGTLDTSKWAVGNGIVQVLADESSPTGFALSLKAGAGSNEGRVKTVPPFKADAIQIDFYAKWMSFGIYGPRLAWQARDPAGLGYLVYEVEIGGGWDNNRLALGKDPYNYPSNRQSWSTNTAYQFTLVVQNTNQEWLLNGQPFLSANYRIPVPESFDLVTWDVGNEVHIWGVTVKDVTPPGSTGGMTGGKSDKKAGGDNDERKIGSSKPPAAPEKATDGQGRIAFVSNRDGNDEIYIIDSDGTNQKRITKNDVSDLEPIWSPDGKRIAYISYMQNKEAPPRCNIIISSSNGSDQRSLTDGFVGHCARELAWSPDGSKIVYAPPFGDIFVIDPDGTNHRNLTKRHAYDCYDLIYSPDGTKIAFTSNRYPNQECQGQQIYVMDADGGNQRDLSNKEGYHFDPSWSPDSTRIAYVSRPKYGAYQGRHNIWVVNHDGSNPICITNNVDWVRMSNPKWSPDGTEIIFTSELLDDAHRMVRSNIEVVRAEGDFQRNIIISFLDYRVEWSLAGNKILFVSNRDGNNEIYSMNADGSDQLRLTYNPADDHSPVWSPR